MKIASGQSANVSVAFVNAGGHPAKVQGDVSWESSDPAIATVSANPSDSKQATITAGPKAGECEIYATADADMGEGIKEVEAGTNVVVIARGEAVGGEITRHSVEHGLPGGPVDPGFGQPGQPAHPDQGLPGGPPDHASGQPVPGGRPDNTLPGGPPDHASGQPTPPQPGPDQGLPGQGHPDQGLPPTAAPKR